VDVGPEAGGLAFEGGKVGGLEFSGSEGQGCGCGERVVVVLVLMRGAEGRLQ